MKKWENLFCVLAKGRGVKFNTQYIPYKCNVSLHVSQLQTATFFPLTVQHKKFIRNRIRSTRLMCTYILRSPRSEIVCKFTVRTLGKKSIRPSQYIYTRMIEVVRTTPRRLAIEIYKFAVKIYFLQFEANIIY